MEDHPEVQAALLVASDQAGDGGVTTALANRMERLAVEEAGESMEYVLRLGSEHDRCPTRIGTVCRCGCTLSTSSTRCPCRSTASSKVQFS